ATTFTVAEPETADDLSAVSVSGEALGAGDAPDPPEAPDPPDPPDFPDFPGWDLLVVVAVIVAAPALTPVTTPLCETLAIFGFDEVHTRVGSEPPALANVPVAVASSVVRVKIVGVGNVTLSADGGDAEGELAFLADFADPAARPASAAAVAAECTIGLSTVSQSARIRPASTTAMPSTGNSHSG